jgi:hypothetical protein
MVHLKWVPRVKIQLETRWRDSSDKLLTGRWLGVLVLHTTHKTAKWSRCGLTWWTLMCAYRDKSLQSILFTNIIFPPANVLVYVMIMTINDVKNQFNFYKLDGSPSLRWFCNITLYNCRCVGVNEWGCIQVWPSTCRMGKKMIPIVGLGLFYRVRVTDM